MMEILQQIDRLKAELDALRPLDAEREVRVMQKFRLDWNFHSNHLEGNSLSYGETKALILFGITAQGKPLKDHLEMTGHNEAIKWIEEVVQEERPLTENFIRQLHKLLLKEPYQVDAVTPDGQPTKKWVKVGEYKTTPNNVITVTGEPFFFASPEETPAKMHDLIEWYRAKKEEAKFHPLLLAAEFHYKFVRIHPFDDGNGRTARILMNFILMQHGLPPVIIKTQDKENYFAALRQADAGLLEPFIEYIGENLLWSLELIIKGAKGESIDEADDSLKAILLHEQKLKSLDNPIKAYKAQKSIQNIFDNGICKLIDEFVEKCSQFSKLYSELTFEMVFGNDMRNSFENSNSLKKTIIKKSNIFNPFHLVCYFRKFRYPKLSDIRFQSSFELDFQESHYLIKTDYKIIKKLYSEYLTEIEITEVLSLLNKEHNKFIEKKIEEAQQSTGDLQSPN